jgi:fatty-acyl-CoA synthase
VRISTLTNPRRIGQEVYETVRIRGGENIYPREIEEFLYQHPGISDVQVFGLPDERFGEELCAWIRPKTGVELTEMEVRDFCHERIAYFKIPRYILFVDEFPMTVTGKMQKFVMRQRMVDELRLRVQDTA